MTVFPNILLPSKALKCVKALKWDEPGRQSFGADASWISYLRFCCIADKDGLDARKAIWGGTPSCFMKMKRCTADITYMGGLAALIVPNAIGFHCWGWRWMAMCCELVTGHWSWAALWRQTSANMLWRAETSTLIEVSLRTRFLIAEAGKAK